MHILIVHRYYWPDTPAYARMLHIQAQHYVEQGHKVTVFSTQPCYNGNYPETPSPSYENVAGVEIFRTPLLRESKKTKIRRALNVLLFCLSLMVHCLRRFRKYDLMTVASFPPVVMGLTARVLGFLTGTKYLYHCQDLYPETVIASGMMKTSSRLASITRSIELRNCKKAAAVVVLSEDMKQTVLRRSSALDNVQIINNFIIDEFDPAVPIAAELQKVDGKFRILFAGNLGRFQNLDALMEAAHQLSGNEEIHFWFVGEGAMKEELIEQAGALLGKTVFFHPFMPLKEVMVVISQTQLSIVSLNPGVIDCAYPSKTMSYLEAGSRLLVLVEPDSELANFVTENSIGTVCEDPSAGSFVSAVTREYERWKQGQGEDVSPREVGRSSFGQRAILSKWAGLLDSIAKENSISRE